MTRPSWLWPVLGAYLVVGALFALFTPPWQNPDEPAHYNYVVQLAGGRLPSVETTDWDAALVPIPPNAREVPVARYTYEDHQPPLFYALAVPLYGLFEGALVPLRWFALAIGAVGVAGAFGTARAIFPQRPAIAALAAAIVALLPQHLAVMASFNNDALSQALIALCAWQGARLLGRDAVPSRREALGLGVTVGLAVITKATAYLCLPLAVLALWGTRRTSWSHWGAMLAPVLLIGLPWWARNIALYGNADFLGLQAHNAIVVGQPTTAEWLAQYGVGGLLRRLLQTTFQSFWGQFGWMSVPLDERWYLALLALTLTTGALFLAWWWREGRALHPAQQRVLRWLSVLVAMTVLAFGWYNLQFVQHQGRYLYPALIPFALAASLGWTHRLGCWERHSWWVALLAFGALDLYLLWRVILPAMS
ncbi:MAG: DUF2142 domain-containing protein [Thermoflexales bacterium]